MEMALAAHSGWGCQTHLFPSKGAELVLSHINMDQECHWELGLLKALIRPGSLELIRETTDHESGMLRAFRDTLSALGKTWHLRPWRTLRGENQTSELDRLRWCQQQLRDPAHAEIIRDSSLFDPEDSGFCFRHKNDNLPASAASPPPPFQSPPPPFKKRSAPRHEPRCELRITGHCPGRGPRSPVQQWFDSGLPPTKAILSLAAMEKQCERRAAGWQQSCGPGVRVHSRISGGKSDHAIAPSEKHHAHPPSEKRAVAPSEEHALTPSPRIPRLIMQTGRYASESRSVEWLRLNPGWRYVFLDDRKAVEFLASVSQKHVDAFNILVHGATKADFVRLIWIQVHGGAYIDLDNEPCDLKPYTTMADVVLSKLPSERNDGADRDCTSNPSNAVIIAQKASPLITAMGALALSRVEQRYRTKLGHQSCYAMTGPTLVGYQLKLSVQNHCKKKATRCSTRFDQQACNFLDHTVYTTDAGERLLLLLEGRDAVTIRQYQKGAQVGSGNIREGKTTFSAYGVGCEQGIAYKDVPPWTAKDCRGQDCKGTG